MTEEPDFEVYMRMLFAQTLAAVTPAPDPMLDIRPDVDVKNLDDILPLLSWHLTGSGETSNGDGLWLFSLNVNYFGDGMDQAKTAMRLGHGLIHSWNDNPWSSAITVGTDRINVMGVDDDDLPDRFPSADIPGRHVVQYSGIYPLRLRSS